MYEAKDLQRIRDIESQDPSKWEGLASKMSKLITDREKCHRRFLASVEIFGDSHIVTQIFLTRWHVLNGMEIVSTGKIIAGEKEIETVKQAAPESDKVIFGSDLPREGETDLPDLSTRKGRAEGILEVWRTWSMQIVHIFRESEKPRAAISAVANFNDEGRNFIFGGSLIDWVPSRHRAEAEKRYGKPVEERVYEEVGA